MKESQIRALTSAGFSGTIVLPDDPAYGSLRKTYGNKDAKPAIIVQARNAKDVSAAVLWAQEQELLISIRSGKHNVAGFSTNDGGVVLDLSSINDVTVLDAEAGLVKIGTGAHWADVAEELGRHGLAISSGDTKSVGVGGLTLSGGIGWMLRKYGYAIDCLEAAEVVLADGSIVRTSRTELPDLFWATQGGGGNVGVVTYFEFKSHKQGAIVAGTLTYQPKDILPVLSGWREAMRQAPRELTSFVTLMPGFGDVMPPSILMSQCYADGDDEAAAQAAIEPLRHIGPGGSGPTNDDTSQKPYADILEEAHPPEGLKFTVKSMYIKRFSDELFAKLAEYCCKPGGPVVQLRYMGGAIDDVAPDATAMPHRGNEGFLFAGIMTPLGASEEQEAEAMKAWDAFAAFGNGAYANFLSTDTPEDVAAVYPEATYARLATIKQHYDPKNVFRHNYNVKPAA